MRKACSHWHLMQMNLRNSSRATQETALETRSLSTDKNRSFRVTAVAGARAQPGCRWVIIQLLWKGNSLTS